MMRNWTVHAALQLPPTQVCVCRARVEMRARLWAGMVDRMKCSGSPLCLFSLSFLSPFKSNFRKKSSRHWQARNICNLPSDLPIEPAIEEAHSSPALASLDRAIDGPRRRHDPYAGPLLWPSGVAAVCPLLAAVRCISSSFSSSISPRRSQAHGQQVSLCATSR